MSAPEQEVAGPAEPAVDRPGEVAAPEPLEPPGAPGPERVEQQQPPAEQQQQRPTAGLTAFMLHLHPPRVRTRTASPAATLGLGLATLVSLALVTVSGILLAFYYVPAVDRAHASVQDIMAVVPAGRFMRNLHRWSGHATVLFCLLHMLRTLLWGAYRGTHRRVWLVGVGLLITVIATSFSGYLLPWDQDAYWTVTVGTSLVDYVPGVGTALSRMLLGGGHEVGQTTLTRFFMLHVLLLPALGLVLLVLHLFRLRRAGGLARPVDARGPGEDLVPAARLISRELALTLLLTTALVVLAALVDVRLGPAPDLVRPDNPPKAPWFLVGLQEMVGYSATLGGFVFPTLLLLLLALGPWVDGGRCDGVVLPGRMARIVVPGTAVLVAAATVAAVLWWGDPQQGVASWLNPATIASLAALLLALACWGGTRRRSLAYQALVIGLVSALTVLTLVGWYCRGPDWSLTYHPGPGHDAAGVERGGHR